MLFKKLPKDIQRIICLFLSDGEHHKLDTEIFEENDIYWTLKWLKVTHGVQPSRKTCYEVLMNLDANHFDYKKFGLYDKYLFKLTWNTDLVMEMINDEIFCTYHVNCLDKSGKNLLSYVCGRQNFPNRVNIVKKLLSYGAKDSYALHYYCNTSDSLKEHPIIRMLVQHGADVNGNPGEHLPLCWANDISVIKVLIELGADVFAKDRYNRSALEYHRYFNHSDIEKYLEDYISRLEKDN